MASPAEALLDFSQPFNVSLLDSTVNAFYRSADPTERATAEAALKQLSEHPDAWTRVDAILEGAQDADTKYYGLQILERQIKYRWATMPAEQRDGIKNYLSNMIIKLSADEAVFRASRTLLQKLNLTLVAVLKHEWPHNWPTFIADITGASKTSETLCENTMGLLKLLSEEVFDFSRGEMTQTKIKEMKNSLNNEFALIHELCELVLTHSQRLELLRATLETLRVFLGWIPLGYIFESQLLESLLRLLPQPALRNPALQCLTEIGSLVVGDYYNQHFVKMYMVFVQQLQAIVPPSANIPEAYENGTDEEQAFLQNLALFLAGFFRAHIRLLKGDQAGQQLLLTGLEYLIKLSYIDDDEVFKVCLDYWNSLVCDLFQLECVSSAPNVESPFAFRSEQGADAAKAAAERTLFAAPMSKLRLLMISRMAKPEEILIVEDENGNIVRETLKDNDVLMQYKTMKETLVFLSHLDHDDTEQQMIGKLSLQLNGTEWSWNNLNTLCWAIGSISGSMAEDQENRFLVTVIRDLLNLCEKTRGKPHKAVIASNIMYVVGQYPRFLRAHWKFLRTVVNKLFEFMHESHPGVQDMAVDTLLKIAQKCKRKFVILQMGEQQPFLNELLSNLQPIICDLEPAQVHVFYEAIGQMVQSESDQARRDQYLLRLMDPPNVTWAQIIRQARTNVEVLKDPNVIKNLANILRTNVGVCTSLGQPFVTQLQLIFVDMLHVYKLYSELVSAQVASGGQHATRTSIVKLLRSVKKEVLRLIECFVERAEDCAVVGQQFVPEMLDPILGDYARSVPDARDAEVLSLFATIVERLQGEVTSHVPRIFEAVFDPTLQMITRNFEDFPDHRLKFFSLLRAIANNCFDTLLRLDESQLKLVMDSIVWAIRHTERNVAETGLNLLLELLRSFAKSAHAMPFYKAFYMPVLTEIFSVLTDTFHKPGFKLHALILQHMFTLAESPVLNMPLWDASEGQFPSNSEYVSKRAQALLVTSFPNMQPAQVGTFVAGLSHLKADLPQFKNHLRDFLVQTKEFSATNNSDLYAEEAAREAEAARQKALAIPGMVKPSEINEGMAD